MTRRRRAACPPGCGSCLRPGPSQRSWRSSSVVLGVAARGMPTSPPQKAKRLGSPRTLLPQLEHAASPDEVAGGWRVAAGRVTSIEDQLTRPGGLRSRRCRAGPGARAARRRTRCPARRRSRRPASRPDDTDPGAGVDRRAAGSCVGPADTDPVVESVLRRRGHVRSTRSHQRASALAFSAANSSSVIAPESSNRLPSAICAVGLAVLLATCLMYSS